MTTSKGFELTYCTNIHPADGWPQVHANLRKYAPELKRRLSPDAPFGIGLRLSNQEAVDLLAGSTLKEFADFLQQNGLYVALINGFPFGGFHGCELKDQVFAPDWNTVERVEYTLRLIEILRKLLPEGLDGGVSTCPLSYKRWRQAGRTDWEVLIANIVRTAAAMHEVRPAGGRMMHLDIEPEPDGLIENGTEVVSFYERLLHTGAPLLARQAQLSISQAEDALRQHVAVCYDICHSSVEYERPTEILQALRAAGIRVGRVQVSSAVRVRIPRERSARSDLKEYLGRFADSTYLHQTIGHQERFADLPEALSRLEDVPDSEWRIHYHVPLFVEDYGIVTSTQRDVREALSALNRDQVSHLEIETYTWGVLPDDLKLDLVDSIEREYRWVLPQV